jgi:dTDP-4-dehydrorhamnose 3,5-epimerase-like enzyme
MYKEERTKIIMCIQVNWSMWDHPLLLPNGHILTIYLEFVPIHGDELGWFTKCECEDENVHVFSWTRVLNSGHYSWLKGLLKLLHIYGKEQNTLLYYSWIP